MASAWPRGPRAASGAAPFLEGALPLPFLDTLLFFAGDRAAGEGPSSGHAGHPSKSVRRAPTTGAANVGLAI